MQYQIDLRVEIFTSVQNEPNFRLSPRQTQLSPPSSIEPAHDGVEWLCSISRPYCIARHGNANTGFKIQFFFKTLCVISVIDIPWIFFLTELKPIDLDIKGKINFHVICMQGNKKGIKLAKTAAICFLHRWIYF